MTDALITMRASAGLKATGAVLSGNAKEVILGEAQKWAADLIVVGSHGRRGFKRFLLGSASEAVVMNADCLVVVVVRGPAARRSRGGGKSFSSPPVQPSRRSAP